MKFKIVFFILIVFSIILGACNGKEVDSNEYFDVRVESTPISSGNVDITIIACPTKELEVSFASFDDWGLEIFLEANGKWDNIKENNSLLDDGRRYLSSDFQVSGNAWIDVSEKIPVWEENFEEGNGCQKLKLNGFFQRTSSWNHDEVQACPFDSVIFNVKRELTQSKIHSDGSSTETETLAGKGVWECDLSAGISSISGNVVEEPEVSSVETNIPTKVVSDPKPEVEYIIPENFYMHVTEYAQTWQFGVPDTDCTVKTSYILTELVDEEIAKIGTLTLLENANRGDCSWIIYEEEELLINRVTGELIDQDDPRFVGNQKTPDGAAENSFEGLSTWDVFYSNEIPWEDYIYTYDYDLSYDQYTGIRIFRERNGSRTLNGILDEGYCQWGQMTAFETNALLGGESGHKEFEYDLEASDCASLEETIAPPSGDPCDVVASHYQMLNDEDLDGYFNLRYTNGWSNNFLQQEMDWRQWYYDEYDYTYTMNSCQVDWISEIPPYAAQVTANVRFYSVYNGTINDATSDATHYLTYDNSGWKLTRNWSLEDVNSQSLNFVNFTDKIVEVFWIDYEKNERSWFELEPWESRINIKSAQTHFWTFYDKETGERLLAYWVPENPDQVVIWIP